MTLIQYEATLILPILALSEPKRVRLAGDFLLNHPQETHPLLQREMVGLAGPIPSIYVTNSLSAALLTQASHLKPLSPSR